MVYLKRTLYKLYSFVFIDLIILMELTALTIIQAFEIFAAQNIGPSSGVHYRDEKNI
jgi:hypothetical protein